MSTDNTVEELTTIVDGMKSEEEFSLLDAVRDVSYPTASVAIYLDGELANELNELRADREAILAEEAEQDTKSLSNPDLADIDERIKGVTEAIRRSRLTVHMRGVAPAVKKAIARKARATFKTPKNADENEKNEIWLAENTWVTNELIAHSIIKVVNAKGAVDKRAKTNDEVQALSDRLAESEFQKLDALCAKLSGASQLFSESLDADFLPKPSADQ